MGFTKPRTKVLRLAAVAAGIAAMGTLWSTPGTSADYTMKIGLVTFKDAQHHWADQMKEKVEAKSNGKIEVKVFPRGELGPIPRQIEGLQLGTVEAFVSPTDFFSGIDPRFGVFSSPGLFPDKAAAHKAIKDPEVEKEALGLGSDKGLRVGTLFPHSTVHYLGKEPIRRLEDFKGKKFRVNATPAERERMSRLGATAVPMPLGEVVPALQRGTIDGTMSGISIFVVFKFIDVAKVLTQTDDTMLISSGVISQPFLDKLPADLRKVVLDAAEEVQQPVAQFGDKQEAEMIENWKKSGGELIKLPAADQAKLEALIGDVGEEVTKGKPAVNAFYKKLYAAAR